MTKDKAVEKDWTWKFYKAMGFRCADDEDDRIAFNKFMNKQIQITAKAKDEENIIDRNNFNEFVNTARNRISFYEDSNKELKKQIKQLKEKLETQKKLWKTSSYNKTIEELKKENEELKEELHIRNGEIKINGKWVNNNDKKQSS